MLTAFLTQSPQRSFDARARSFLDSPQKIQAALKEVDACRGIVMHAVLDPEAKRLIERH